MTSRWPEVSAERMCPVCNKHDRCKIAPDGNAARCFRVSDQVAGWRCTRRHGNGGGTFHRVGSTPPTINGRPSRSTTQPQSTKKSALPPHTIDRIYRRLLELCPITGLHGGALLRRGFTKDEIERRGYGTMPISRDAIIKKMSEQFSAQALLAMPGFALVDGVMKLGGASGLIVPVRNVDGMIVALKVRSDKPGKGMPRYSYLSSVGHGGYSPGSPCHVPLGICGSAPVVRITEGELKADVAYAISGVPTISFAGVDNWKSVIPVLKTLAAESVHVSIDADCRTNKQVAARLLECVKTLRTEGSAVKLETWDIVDGKGIDDLLVSGKQPQIIDGDAALSAAEEIAKQAGATPATADVTEHELVRRLRNFIEDHGIPALFQNIELLKEIAAVAPTDKPLFAALRTTARELRVPMRDWNEALKPLIKDAAKLLPPTLARDETGGFFIHDGCLARERKSMTGEPEIIPLANFYCRIIDETRRDDGSNAPDISFGVEGAIQDGRPLKRTEVPAEKFARMEWIAPAWGSAAIVWPNEIRAMTAAIQAVSREGQEGVPPKQYRHVFTHTGWREIEGKWRYLHAGGTIPATAKDSSYSVELQPPLSRYSLPSPPTGEERITSIHASLALLAIAPNSIIYPLLAAIVRAPLGTCDFAISLVGSSGIGKTAIAALALQHFGAGLDAQNLPGSWSSTANCNEKLAFLTKDSLLVVDDFAPAGDPKSVQRYRQAGEQVFRAQGNNAGRGRMNADGTLRPSYPPRGLLLSTGEDVAGGQSARARQLIVEVSPGDITPSALTPHQKNAADGLFAQTMAGYIAWIAPQYEQVQRQMKEQVAELRHKAKSEHQHARTPGIVADLVFAFSLFLEFAEQAGAITAEQRLNLQDDCWKALVISAEDQTAHQTASDPTKQFMRLLGSGVGTGRFHLARADDGGPPHDQAAWGWRQEPGNSRDWRPRGQLIGWIDNNERYVYLDPAAAFTEVQRYAGEQGLTLPVTERTLRKMLHDRGLLVEVDSVRDTRTVRRTINRKPQAVLCLSAESISSAEEPTKPTNPTSEAETPFADTTYERQPRKQPPPAASPSTGAATSAADVDAESSLDGQSDRRQVDCQEIWQVNGSQPTMNGAVKRETNGAIVGNVRPSAPTEQFLGFEEYEFNCE